VSRVVLIGCGKTKASAPCAAEDLYTGPLFRARRAYAEAADRPWWIVSAQHGLMSPEQITAPYDTAGSDLCAVDHAAWALTVAHSLLDELEDGTRLRDVVVEIHAGAWYAQPLVDVLRALGIGTHLPVEGLGIGEQLAWYPEATRWVERGMLPPVAERRSRTREGAAGSVTVTPALEAVAVEAAALGES
jgi:hypothetical protein